MTASFSQVLLALAAGVAMKIILTTKYKVQHFCSALELSGASGKLLCVLFMGAGSMMISHADDAYFWVIIKILGT